VPEWQSQIVKWLHFSLAKEMVRYVLFHILHFCFRLYFDCFLCIITDKI
jgi:hypothetical protein